jgi:hypothetical protein
VESGRATKRRGNRCGDIKGLWSLRGHGDGEPIWRYALWAFEQCSSHKGRTAEALEVDPKTLAKWLNGDPDDNG